MNTLPHAASCIHLGKTKSLYCSIPTTDAAYCFAYVIPFNAHDSSMSEAMSGKFKGFAELTSRLSEAWSWDMN